MSILNLADLRTQVNNDIKTNGVRAITGNIMNVNLIDMIDSIESDYDGITGGLDSRLTSIETSALLILQDPSTGWDASVGTFPGGGTAKAGYYWNVSTAGTVDGIAFDIGDSLLAILDNASTGTYAANWSKKDDIDSVISVAGKVGAITLVASDITDFDVEVSNNTDVAANTAKVTNVTTDLSVGANTATQIDIESSDGTNATLSQATTLLSGLMSAAKFNEIVANNSKVSNVSTDLSIGTKTAATVDVNSSDGTNATVPSFTSTEAGLTPASAGGTTNFLRADGSWAAGGAASVGAVNEVQITDGSGAFLSGKFKAETFVTTQYLSNQANSAASNGHGLVLAPTSTALNAPSGGSVQLAIGNAPKLFVDVNGDVGIGTGAAAVGHKLHVKESTNSTSDFPFLVTNLAETPIFNVRADARIGISTTTLDTANTITAAPNHQYLLSATGNFQNIATMSGIRLSSTGTATNHIIGLDLTANTNNKTYLGNVAATTSATLSGLQSSFLIYNGAGDLTDTTSRGINLVTKGENASFNIRTSNTVFDTTNTIRLKVDKVGNIGIGTGTGTPTAKLHVKGSGATSGTTALLVENSAGTDALKVLDDTHSLFGGAANGTAQVIIQYNEAVDDALYIKNSTTTTHSFHGGAGAGGLLRINDAASATKISLNGSANALSYFNTGSSGKIVFGSTTAIGVSKVNIDYDDTVQDAMQIVNGGSITHLWGQIGSGNGRYRISNGGVTGVEFRGSGNNFMLGDTAIGVATASAKLHVVGSTLLNGNLGLFNTTPIAQPTTGIGAAIISAGSGTNALQDDTYDGYTMSQIVKALRDLGALA